MTESRPQSQPEINSAAGRGWDLMGGDRGKWHFFAVDGRALCSKWAIFHRNLLAWDVHPDNQCAACRRKYEKLAARAAMQASSGSGADDLERLDGELDDRERES